MGYVLVTTALTAAENSIVSLSDVKDELGITSGDQDALLTRYIKAATTAAEQYCNRIFSAISVKDEFWPEREDHAYQVIPKTPQLVVSQWPIIAVESVTENGTALVDGENYRVDYASGRLIRLNQQPYPTYWNAWPIVATYTGGFATIPADVQDAVIRLVKARYMSRDRDPFLKSENIPGVRDASFWVPTGSDAGNMPPAVADILDNYRQPVVA